MHKDGVDNYAAIRVKKRRELIFLKVVIILNLVSTKIHKTVMQSDLEIFAFRLFQDF
jgi:hypothetical protein